MTASDNALNRSAAYASIAVAVFLVGLKAWAALSTGSTAMLGSLADTALDLVASLATLAGVTSLLPRRELEEGRRLAVALTLGFAGSGLFCAAWVLSALPSITMRLRHERSDLNPYEMPLYLGLPSPSLLLTTTVLHWSWAASLVSFAWAAYQRFF